MPLTHHDKLFIRHALDEVKSINQLFKPEIVGHKAGVPIKELEAVVNNLAKEGIMELHQTDTGTHRISFTEPRSYFQKLWTAATAQAAIRSPSTNTMPSIRSRSFSLPFSFLQRDSALRASLNAMARPASRLPGPLVRYVRRRTVANVLSIGLLVRRCPQCSAGKS